MDFKNEIILSVKDLKKVYKVPKKVELKNRLQKFLSLFYRKWEEKIAIQDINFTIKRGEIVGYIGRNGAGKSTTIKILTGILYPTEGEVRGFNNLNPFKEKNAYKKRMGVIFGQRTLLDWDIPIKDSFELFKGIYNLDDDFYENRIKFFIDLLDLGEIYNRPYRMLSLGEKMKANIAVAFLHKPELVFLDEPTIGLDVSSKEKIRKFLKKINKEEGVTIILTTHDMGDIEELSERIIFIEEGKIMYDGSLTNFKKRYANWKNLIIRFKKIKDKKGFEKIKKKYNLEIIDEFTLKKRTNLTEGIGPILKILFKYLDIVDIKIEEPKLENVVRNLLEK